jgi:RNA polymerase sigma-70 factor (ECF subfamily)
MDGAAGDPLLDGLAEGREDAYAALYDRHGPALYRVARALTLSSADAEDAVQDVFVGLVQARRTLRSITNLRAYLFASLRRAAARVAQRRGPQPLVALAETEVAAASGSGGLALEQAVRLERALARLPAPQRELIALKIDGGLTFGDIAEVLGISANTAASRYRYALEKLRADLEERP